MSRLLSALRAEYLLPFAVTAAAVVVAASEFMTMFEFDLGSSGELRDTIPASERHSYALVVIAGFALVALAIALVAGSRPAATAVAAAGVLSLLIFLLADLPDVNQEGTVSDPSTVFYSSKAEPANGFWLEMVGTIALAASGAALATLRPEQLTMLYSRVREGRRHGRRGAGSGSQALRTREPSLARTQGGRRSERTGEAPAGRRGGDSPPVREQDARPRT